MTTININLLGIEQKDRLRFRSGMNIDRGLLGALTVAVVGIVLAVGGTLVMNGLVASAEENKATLEQEVKDLETQLGEINSLRTQKATAEAEKRILSYVTGRTYRWSRFLNEIRDITPENLWVSSISVTGDALTISGNTFDHQTVAYFLANLQASPLFINVGLTQSDKAVSKTGVTAVSFSLKAQINYEVVNAPASDEPARANPTNASGQFAPDTKQNADRGKAALRGNKSRAAQDIGG